MTIEQVKSFGIVGAGGAGFPAHIKLQSHPEFLIMNAAECEPLVHKDAELLRHHSREVMAGLEIAMEMTGAPTGIIGIKEKQQDIISTLSAIRNGNVKIHPCADFYPAGDEMTLVYLTTGRVVQPGNLPGSAGCLVQNVETLYNLAQSKPVIHKFLSVSGAVDEPATIRVPIGTSYDEILSHFSVTVPNPGILSGGIMMGRLETDGQAVVSKRTNAIILLPADHYCIQMYERFTSLKSIDRIAKAGCDQCNFCTEFCPRYLLGHPVRPETAMRNRLFSPLEENVFHPGNAFCCECNLCTLFACPESLDPKGATSLEKSLALRSGSGWEGLPVAPHPMFEYRRVSTEKLKQRLDIQSYRDEAPFKEVNFEPQQVRIPLQQHVGTPAKPVVSPGKPVKTYDLIAEATGNISANVHASIDGKVTEVTTEFISIQRD